MISPAAAALAIHLAAPSLDDARVQRYAEDIASVSADLDEAFALVATAKIESGFDPKVETCVRTGDLGRSVSLFQLQTHWRDGHSRAEVCSSNRLAAWLALRALRSLGFTSDSWWPAFRAYVGCAGQDARVVLRAKFFERLKKEVRD